MFEGLGGAQLAAAVAAVDPHALPADEALDYALAAARVAGWATAAEAAGLARMHATYPADGLDDAGVDHGLDPDRLAVAEVRAAYGVSQPAAGHKLGFADALAAPPRLAQALRTGLLGLDPVRVLVRDSEPLAADPATRRAAADAVLDAHRADLDSGGSGLTVRQVSLRIRRAVLAADPDRAERQAERARRDRRVWHQPDPAHAEGAFTLTGPVQRTTECEAAVDALARAWRAHGATGTLDQLRFDAAHHLLTSRPGTHHADDRQTDSPPTRGGDDDLADEPDASTADHADPAADPRTGCVPSGQRVGQVTVPLSTLLGLDDAPGEIAGAGPVPASVARSLMAQASVWRRLLTDPADAHLVTQQVRSYRPTQAMRDYVLARTGGVCSARGCGNRRGVQIDHVDPHPHGPTTGTNLDPECTPDHNAKTHGQLAARPAPRRAGPNQPPGQALPHPAHPAGGIDRAAHHGRRRRRHRHHRPAQRATRRPARPRPPRVRRPPPAWLVPLPCPRVAPAQPGRDGLPPVCVVEHRVVERRILGCRALGVVGGEQVGG